MEAAAVAASASAAAARDAALAASVAAAAAAATANEASAAAKEAAVAASAAALNAKEAAATASAAALNAKEAAATASAAALDAKEAAAVAATAGEVAVAAAAAMRASKNRKFHLIDGSDQDPPGSENIDDVGSVDFVSRLPDDDQGPPGTGNVDDVGSVDFISRLPDAVLCSIVSLLPTKEGARTQAISRRWRPFWRSAPLNLVVDRKLRSKGHTLIDLIRKILSEHPGPARHLLLDVFIRECYDRIEGWLSSEALDNLQEFELTYHLWRREREKQLLYLLPSSAYRFAPTLRVAKLSGCHIPDLIVQLSLKFPCLQQLTLREVAISEEALRSMLSGCLALESLELRNNFGFGRLCISSQTLKSLGFCSGWRIRSVLLQELVIEDAPCLERLLPLYPRFSPVTVVAIRVLSAPKLKILGVLSKEIAELQFGATVFQKMIAVGLTTIMRTVRVLVLHANLDTVLNFFKCFPCLARLYVEFQSGRVNVPLDPVECLELHLKEVVLQNYDSLDRSSIDFAKFFVLNAKVLKEMRITLPYHRQHKWFANQHMLLQTENRASRDARIELTCGSGTREDFTTNGGTHDLSTADPFDMPSRRCSKCMELMRKKSLLL